MKKVENSKTEDGAVVVARQRIHKKNIPVGRARLSVGPTGALQVTSNVGEERGMVLAVAITLDEVLAQQPQMVEAARKYAAKKAPEG